MTGSNVLSIADPPVRTFDDGDSTNAGVRMVRTSIFARPRGRGIALQRSNPPEPWCEGYRSRPGRFADTAIRPGVDKRRAT